MYEFKLGFAKHPCKEHASYESKKEKLEHALYRKFETYNPRYETVQPSFSISTFLYLGAIYIFPRLVLLNPHQKDQGRKGPCYFQRLNALKCLKCQKI
jgi:hypothetical protein